MEMTCPTSPQPCFPLWSVGTVNASLDSGIWRLSPGSPVPQGSEDGRSLAQNGNPTCRKGKWLHGTEEG